MPARQRQPPPPSASIYSQWRVALRADILHVAPPRPPPEQFLQAVWQHQRLYRDVLHTADGRPLRILHPGFWNHEPGPDFRQAVLQIGDASPSTGDIEIDLCAANWHAHGHDTNSVFTAVILHVIWNGPTKIDLPTLRLQPHLDASLKHLADWQATSLHSPFEYTGKCRPSSPPSPVLFRTNSFVKPQRPPANQGRRLHPPRPPLRLGHRPLARPFLCPQLQAQHMAHAKPCRVPPRSACPRPRRCHRLAGSPPRVRRPAYKRSHHPEPRRLALLAHWLASGDLTARLQTWLETDCSKTQFTISLTQALHVTSGELWQHHWTFKSPRQPKLCSLLGATRATDLAINILLSWFHARTRTGRNPALLAHIVARYTTWPPSQDNVLLKLARQRLFATPRRLLTAAHQQGLLQILRDFCDHAPSTCEGCRFPDLVRSFPA